MGAGGWGDLAGARVVVIDDSSTICHAAEAVLRRAGCRVITAADGFAALADIIEHRPHLILVDDVMPRLDGYETCAVIKRNRQFRHTPVVLLTDLDAQFERVRGDALGVDDYLSKPFSREELLNTVRRHLL